MPYLLRSFSWVYIIILSSCMVLIGCRKFVELSAPKEQLTTTTIFNNEELANRAMISIYQIMSSQFSFASGVRSITLLGGLSSDELVNYSADVYQNQFSTNDIDPGNKYNYALWSQLYQAIYGVNSIIEGVSNSPYIEKNNKIQLLGEACFLRAFFYFYLLNLYGRIPMPLTAEYRTNETLLQMPIDMIYGQIIADLLIAKAYLPDGYDHYKMERVRPTKYAAESMLARTYLYLHKWENCILESTSVINRRDLYQLCTDLNQTFLKNSKEAILQLQPTLTGYNTLDGNMFILNSAPTIAAIRPDVIKIVEQDDKRFLSWIKDIEINGSTYYYPTKYKVKNGATVSEYLMVLRLSEQFLIRAEAYAEIGNNDSAIADLNQVRIRAGLLPIKEQSPNEILNAIARERRIEFLAEWGTRWFDLKRKNSTDSLLHLVKGVTWKAQDTLYPIPRIEIELNKNLEQNPGYN